MDQISVNLICMVFACTAFSTQIIFVSNVILFVLIATTSAGRMANERKNVCTESKRGQERDRVKLADTC